MVLDYLVFLIVNFVVFFYGGFLIKYFNYYKYRGVDYFLVCVWIVICFG